MFPALCSDALPVRLVVAATIPIGSTKPATIVVTCDPPSDRFEVVWHQDTVTDVLTPEEACEAITCMVEAALRVIETGRFAEDRQAFPHDQGPRSEVDRDQGVQMSIL